MSEWMVCVGVVVVAALAFHAGYETALWRMRRRAKP
jgi:hypothetical protein